MLCRLFSPSRLRIHSALLSIHSALVLLFSATMATCTDSYNASSSCGPDQWAALCGGFSTAQVGALCGSLQAPLESLISANANLISANANTITSL